MSDFIEYPKAIYSSEGKFAVVGGKDAEDTQREEWGETVLADLPNPLALKMDQDPVANLAPEPPAEVIADVILEPAPEAAPEPAPEPAPAEPAAEPQA